MTYSKDDENKAKEFLENLKEKFQFELGKKFVFLLVGRTGVGKSSTINSLMGKEIAKVGDYEPTTMEVKSYDSEISGVKFTVIDTPGLCDDLEEAGNDYNYLELMRSNVNQIDSMWFVSRLDETRVTSDEKRGIKLISEAFGSKVWENAVIIFTFANAVDLLKYPVALEKRTELIRKEIAKYTGVAVANNIPSVAVDNTSEITPDGQKWLGELYTQVYTRISAKGAVPFFLATVERIKRPEKENQVIKQAPAPSATPRYERPIELNERQAEIVRNKTTDVVGATLAGAGVGSAIGALGGPVGATVGGLVGAAIGFFGSLFRKRK